MKNKSQKKLPELAREPMAYMVFCPSGEYDYRIFTDKHDAEIVAEEYNDQENTDHYKAIPLFM